MNILFAASEMVPYASTGGLGEVMAGLPKILAQDSCKHVYRVMPLYKCVWKGDFNLHDTGMRLNVPIGRDSKEAEVWVNKDVVPITYFIRNDEYFDRAELYSLPEQEYDDNDDRFIFFQKSIIGMIDALKLKIDIVHCNDWQTGLIPLYLRNGMDGKGRESSERTLLTIHNLAYQGIFSRSKFSNTNLPPEYFSTSSMEYYNNISFLKAGITSADLITTVSKTYAQEIQSEKYGCGFHGILSESQNKLNGIVNGIDYTVWDPATDRFLAEKYDRNDLKGKITCKHDILSMMGLPIKPTRPLIGMITRLVEQKGLDILAGAIPKLMEMNINFILLGSGQQRYHKLCESWAMKWPKRVSVKLGYNVELSHKIEGGADLYMMPSKFEPCGLNQLYSLRYGTIPIAHATGGLEDTIEDVRKSGHKGTGFKFKEYTPDRLIETVQRALFFYTNPSQWKKIQKRAMKCDFSWEHSAKEYAKLYMQLL
ncbi:MAG: glycogen synthase GlgA [Kiritimatiellae bacterium]|nr:glycogen synthase GlgA [Kiritimatiellia bacterium]